MKTLFVGDALATLHKFVDCCADWQAEGTCHACRRLMTSECSTCREPLMTREGEFYYEVTSHDDDGAILSSHLVHHDAECLGGVVQEEMLKRADRMAA